MAAGARRMGLLDAAREPADAGTGTRCGAGSAAPAGTSAQSATFQLAGSACERRPPAKSLRDVRRRSGGALSQTIERCCEGGGGARPTNQRAIFARD